MHHPVLRPKTLASKYGSIVQGTTCRWCCQHHHSSVQRAALTTRHLYYLRRSHMVKPAEKRKTAFKQSAGGKNRLSEYLAKSFSHSLASCTSFSFKMSTLSPSSGTLFPDQFTAQLHTHFERFHDAQLWTRVFCFCFLFLPHSSQTFPKLKDPFPRPIYCLATRRVSTLLWCTTLNQVHEWFLAV